MKKRVFYLIGAAALFLMMLGACTNIDSPLVGQWYFVSGINLHFFNPEGRNGDIEFKSNGNVTENAHDQAGKFALDGDRRFNVTIAGNTYAFSYELNGDMLTITDRDGDSATWRSSGSSVNRSVSASDLYGRWDFLSGSYIYHFGWGDGMEFFSDGTVIEYDQDEPGEFSVNNGRLTVVGDWVGVTYQFEVEAVGNTITIIDSDGDRNTYVRR